MAKKSAGAGIRPIASSAYSIAEEQARNAVGRRIAARREEKGLSREAACERLGSVSYSRLVRIEAGETPAYPEEVMRQVMPPPLAVYHAIGVWLAKG